MSNLSALNYDNNLTGESLLSADQFIELALSGELWAQSQWLYALLVIPFIWVLYFLFFGLTNQNRKYTKFADKHLLPYLIINDARKKNTSLYSGLILWSMIWFCLTLAMAGPRWSYREFKAYNKEHSIVVLLDMSLSMNVNDVSPSRFQRARQDIEDILNTTKIRANSKVKIGLVGFAAHAHMISPISEDYSNIKRLLPLLGTDLIAVQGTRLSSALKTAEGMLAMEAGDAKSILIISDGGFEDNGSAFGIISNLDTKGIIVHTMGVGTKEGMAFINPDGSSLLKNNAPVVSRLEEEKLQEASSLGRGKYFNPNILGENSAEFIDVLNSQMDYLKEHDESIKDWDEKFYIFLIPVVFLGFFWFRKGLIFPFIILIMMAPYSASAVDIIDRLTLNDENYAKKALIEDNDPETALEYFDDPYHRGIAYYRAGDFKKAEEEFKKDQSSEYALDSLYNLGNTFAKQGKYEEASKIYNEVIGKDCKHEEAKHNLGIMERILTLVEIEQPKDDNNKKNDSDDHSKLPEGGGGGNDNDDDDSEGGDGNDDDQSKDNDDGDKKDEGQDDDEGGRDDKADKDSDNTCDSGDKNDNQDKGNNQDEVEDNGEQNKEGDDGQDKEAGADGDDNGKNSVDTDEWLNRIENDYRSFLANQFYLESQNQKSNADSNIDPW